MEEKEKRKIKEVITLAKENLILNEKQFEKMCSITDDEYLLYTLSRDYETKKRNLKRAISNPYFARVDFKAYTEGILHGDLRLKRQYNIEIGELLNYNDIDITTNDKLLQDCLNEKSDIRLKNIVSTIQAEQNKIIRASMSKPLIVQGVAGSGKTTVALHRIAYLVYNYEKSFKPDEFLIIAPNKFFLDYISNVLPDLGVDYVRQQTFEEFALDNINDKIQIINPNIELSKIVDEKKNLDTKLLYVAFTRAMHTLDVLI